MKAIVRTQYGPPDVLQFMKVEKPAPKDNEVLIRVYAASVNPLDFFTMRGAPLVRLIPGLRKPKDTRIGVDLAGRVEQTINNKTILGAAHAGFACAGLESTSSQPLSCRPISFCLNQF
jgi:NADPH:quinone reductase-like Zn-dependent oxidoreductase